MREILRLLVNFSYLQFEIFYRLSKAATSLNATACARNNGPAP